MHMNVDFSASSRTECDPAQRLVRLVCPHCGEDCRPDATLLKESGLTEAKRPRSASHRRGCRECRGSGYKGRKAIAELMILNDELRELITARAPVRQLKEAARTSGTRFLRDAALEAVRTANPRWKRSTVLRLSSDRSDRARPGFPRAPASFGWVRPG